MRILAIETSCDETAAAVVADGRRIESNIVYTQIAEHRKYGGVVPEIASRRHVEHICDVTSSALEQAGVTLQEIDAIAVTAWPGLIGALLVGVNYAKGLAFAADKPLVPVHHLRGHVAANYLAHPDLKPPFLALIVSGGHSHLVEVLDYTHYRVIGRTRDDAVGEAYDKAARVMGYPYPGGVALDQAAKTGDPLSFAFPRPKLSETGGSDLDFSFSGLKTAVINTLHRAEQRGERNEEMLRDIAASFQYTVCEILTGNTLAAIERTGAKKLVVAGGVSANSGLRASLTAACSKIGVELYLPPLSLCGDNAAMIGAQGYYEYLVCRQNGSFAGADLNAAATMSID